MTIEFFAPPARRLVGSALTPEFYAQRNGRTVATAADIQDMLDDAEARGLPVTFPAESYTLDEKIAFPDGTRIHGDMHFLLEAVLTVEVGNIATLDRDYDITFGAGCIGENLYTRCAGGEARNFYNIYIGDDCEFGVVNVKADTQRTGGGILTKGQGVRIGELHSVKYDRPLYVRCEVAGTPATGFYCGFLDVLSYVRGIRLDNQDGPCVAGFHIRGRSPNAAIGHAPGTNGILFQGVYNPTFGNGTIEDSGEHGIRVGGSTFDGVTVIDPTKNVRFGVLHIARTGGAAIKLNSAIDRCDGFHVAALFAEDIGDIANGGVVLSQNMRVLRLSHATDVSFGSIHVRANTQTWPLTMAISSASYVSATGVIVLTMRVPATYAHGATVTLSALTGTGAFASLNGAWPATAHLDNTITLAGPIGAGAATVTGGSALIPNMPVAAQAVLGLNDIDGLRIGFLRSDQTFSGIIIDELQDGRTSEDDGEELNSYGPVKNVTIDYCEMKPLIADYLMSAATQYGIGNININNLKADSVLVGIANFPATTPVTGPIRINAEVRGGATRPAITLGDSVAQAPYIYRDVRWGKARWFGLAGVTSRGFSALEIEGPQANFGDTTTGLPTVFLTALSGTAAQWAYGPSYGVGRIGQNRPGAVMALIQTGANNYNTGWKFAVGGVTNSDQLAKEVQIDHTGALYTPDYQTFASNAAAIAGGLRHGTHYKLAIGSDYVDAIVHNP